MKIETSNSIWWSFTITGIIAIVYALLALLVPNEIVPTVVTFIGIAISVIGLICFFITFRRKKNMLPWGMLLFESIVMMAIGIVAIVWAEQTVKFLVFLIGIWSIIIGAFMLFVTLLSRFLVNKGFYFFSGMLSIVFGILLIIKPIASLEIMVIASGIIALVFGVIMMMFGFALRKNDTKATVEVMETPEDATEEDLG